MQSEASRKLISNAHWQELGRAIKEAKHSKAGAPPVHLVRLSLVARRLIVLAGLGMDPLDAVGIGLFLHDGGGRLP